MPTGQKLNYHHRDSCRLCGSEDLAMVLSMPATPPANAFVPAKQVGQSQESFPLDTWLCHGCGHLQLLDVVDPALLFEDYVYVSGTSPTFVQHFAEYAGFVIDECGLKTGDRVLDIGSNDGTLLRHFQNRGMRVLGIDPARDIAARATDDGIETWPEFFSTDVARRVLEEKGPASCVTANNVFAHADDLRAIAKGVRKVLDQDGIFVFEVSYLVDVLEKTLFDTIYHEHLDYHAMRPLLDFFTAADMTMVDAVRVESHGGSIRGIVQRDDGPRRPTSRLTELITREEELGLFDEDTYRRFSDRIDALGRELKSLIRQVRAAGKTVAGFGAPAKATTLMYRLGLERDDIDFIVDDNPLKQGLFTPGLHVPVLSSRAIKDRHPDYLLILAWNFAAPIMEKNNSFHDRGGRFIVPVPEIQIY